MIYLFHLVLLAGKKMASSGNDSSLENKKRSELCHEITYNFTYHTNASNPFYRFSKILFFTLLSLSSCRCILDHDNAMIQPVPKKKPPNGTNEGEFIKCFDLHEYFNTICTHHCIRFLNNALVSFPRHPSSVLVYIMGQIIESFF